MYKWENVHVEQESHKHYLHIMSPYLSVHIIPHSGELDAKIWRVTLGSAIMTK